MPAPIARYDAAMKFCSDCAGPLVEHTPAGDDRPRRWCPACNKAHYQNPLVVVGCLVERGDEVLLCRRAIEPAHGKWTVPAGFLELGETLAAGAARETREEAGAEVEVIAPHSHLDLTHIGQHYAMFRARLTAPDVSPGAESLECAWVSERTSRGPSWRSQRSASRCSCSTGIVTKAPRTCTTGRSAGAALAPGSRRPTTRSRTTSARR